MSVPCMKITASMDELLRIVYCVLCPAYAWTINEPHLSYKMDQADKFSVALIHSFDNNTTTVGHFPRGFGHLSGIFSVTEERLNVRWPEGDGAPPHGRRIWDSLLRNAHWKKLVARVRDVKQAGGIKTEYNFPIRSIRPLSEQHSQLRSCTVSTVE